MSYALSAGLRLRRRLGLRRRASASSGSTWESTSWTSSSRPVALALRLAARQLRDALIAAVQLVRPHVESDSHEAAVYLVVPGEGEPVGVLLLLVLRAEDQLGGAERRTSRPNAPDGVGLDDSLNLEEGEVRGRHAS